MKYDVLTVHQKINFRSWFKATVEEYNIYMSYFPYYEYPIYECISESYFKTNKNSTL